MTELDAGPQTQFRSQEEAKAGSIAHLVRQEKALRDFMGAFPKDEHVFEAQLRLARLLQLRAGLESSEAPRTEARRILDELFKTANGAQRQEVDFARLAFEMRTLRLTSHAQREQLLAAAEHFRRDYPADKRLPALLAEVSGLFDAEPEMKRTLLTEAQAAATDPALQHRIADDLKRLEALGKVLALKFTTQAGKPVDLLDYRGKIVVLIFLAEFSPPATDAVATIQRAAREWPPGAVQVLGVDLDAKAEDLAAVVRQYNVTWPIGFDGKGWQTPPARQYGINRLPTVWLIDQTGTLRSLNGLEAITDQIRGLLKGK